MSRARSILALVLVLAYLLSGGDRGARVLCIEPDGCIAVELAGALCLGDEKHEAPSGERSEPSVAGIPDDCCACIDIPLPGQDASRPASATRALDDLDLATFAPAPSLLLAAASDGPRLSGHAHVFEAPPLLHALRC